MEKNEFFKTIDTDLLKELSDQANSGGYTSSTSQEIGGPYWQKAVWTSYCDRVKADLISQCGYTPEKADEVIRQHSSQVIFLD